MMKYKYILLIILMCSVLFSCFKDEGNYSYEPDEFPNFNKLYKYVSCVKGDTAIHGGDFFFEGLSSQDSIAKLKDLSYQWIIEGGIVLSEKKDLEISSDTIFKKVNATKSGRYDGLYVVIDNASGKKYVYRIYYDLKAGYKKCRWMILSQDGDNSKLCYIELLKNEQKKWYYELKERVFEKENGYKIPGHPINLKDHRNDGISKNNHASFIFTDQVSYVINNENMVKVSDLKDLFTDGAPQDFVAVDEVGYDQFTCLMSADGKIYQRKMSKNYLGGKFITQAYPSDEKGYDIKVMGNIQNFGKVSLLYDKKNNRILGLSSGYSTTGVITGFAKYPTFDESPMPIDLTNLGEGTEVLAMSGVESNIDYDGWNEEDHVVIHNENGKTYLSEFLISAESPYRMVYNKNAYKVELPNTISSDAKIMIIEKNVGNITYMVYYTNGNELRSFNRESEEDKLVRTYNSKVTAISKESVWFSTFPYLVVGCENGDFEFLDVSDPDNADPVLVSQFNVGGKIVSLEQIKASYH